MNDHRVRALLMGGQACVLYGAAEFSRDADFAILADSRNLRRLAGALESLDAVPIAVPPCELGFLRRGHAVHFRCRHSEALRMRVDVMARMRGVDTFTKLWRRRSTFDLGRGFRCDALGLADLVVAKKTQRDKDWPMIRRLVEANYFENRRDPAPAQVSFWLRELRSSELLCAVAKRHHGAAIRAARKRPLIRAALEGRSAALEAELRAEELREREIDRGYWTPLKAELRALARRGRRSGSGPRAR